MIEELKAIWSERKVNKLTGAETSFRCELNNGAIYSKPPGLDDGSVIKDTTTVYTKSGKAKPIIGKGTRIFFNIRKQTVNIQHPDTLQNGPTGYLTDSNFNPIWKDGEKTGAISLTKFAKDFSDIVVMAFLEAYDGKPLAKAA